MFIGETEHSQIQQSNGLDVRSYKNPEFTKSISQELLHELQNNPNIEEGLTNINKALEFVKSNSLH